MNSSKVFMVDKANKTLVCEASDLEGFYAMPNQTIEVTSARTGKVVRFRLVDAKMDRDNDVIQWNLVPEFNPESSELNGWKMVVFND